MEPAARNKAQKTASGAASRRPQGQRLRRAATARIRPWEERSILPLRGENRPETLGSDVELIEAAVRAGIDHDFSESREPD